MSNTSRFIVRAVPKNGFFRAGRHWPQNPVEVELDAETLEAIAAEPKLVVVPAPKPPKGASKE